ncbi:MAG: ATP-binding protein [Pleurocapsa sp. MO_226.B13]|nr:ATP-binding protein [Pleurocapsa sp. MO_226.B13]
MSLPTLQRMIGSKDKSCFHKCERLLVENIVKVLGLKPTDIVDPKDWSPRLIPLEFERLIEEKTKLFCGRKFVFQDIEDFLNEQDRGYFTIIGDPGMGKSAIAAKYVDDNHAICFFNVRAQRINRPELFLKTIREQLKERYDLPDVEDDSLSTLLSKASKKLPTNDSLVIVVDALDEVDQEVTGNLLYLPTILPERVYFLLTRRPYEPSQERLSIDPST